MSLNALTNSTALHQIVYRPRLPATGELKGKYRLFRDLEES